MRDGYIKEDTKLRPMCIGYDYENDTELYVHYKCPICEHDEFDIRQLFSTDDNYADERILNSIVLGKDKYHRYDTNELYAHSCTRCGNILLFSSDMSE